MSEKQPEQLAQRSEPAQNGRDQHPREGAVTLGERSERGMRAWALELIVERAMPAQNVIEDIGRNPPRREAGRFR